MSKRKVKIISIILTMLFVIIYATGIVNATSSGYNIPKPDADGRYSKEYN